jgi:hypothetical protein
MIATLPSPQFSANDFIVQFVNCFDKYQNVQFTKLTSTTGTVAYTGTAAATGVTTNRVIRISYLLNGSIVEFEVKATATPTVDNGVIQVTVNVVGTTMPNTQYVSWYRSNDTLAKMQTLYLGNASKVFELKVRPNQFGVTAIAFGEQIRGLLPAFDYDSLDFKFIVSYYYNGLVYNLDVYRGQKTFNLTEVQDPASYLLTPTKQYYSAFEEQVFVKLRTSDPTNTFSNYLITDFALGFNAPNVRSNNPQFYLYKLASCQRQPIYLSGTYGQANQHIDVSTVILAFIDGYGLFQYARFNGNNIVKYNVENGTLKKDVSNVVSPANNGEIYEAIDLTLESDPSGSRYAYKVTPDEIQRVVGGLMAAPFIWLLINDGDQEYAIPVRIDTSSVKFYGSLEGGVPRANLSIIINQPLGIIQPS